MSGRNCSTAALLRVRTPDSQQQCDASASTFSTYKLVQHGRRVHAAAAAKIMCASRMQPSSCTGSKGSIIALLRIHVNDLLRVQVKRSDQKMCTTGTSCFLIAVRAAAASSFACAGHEQPSRNCCTLCSCTEGAKRVPMTTPVAGVAQCAQPRANAPLSVTTGHKHTC